MIKQLKTLALSAGLVAGLLFGMVGHAQAAKDKAPAAAPAAAEVVAPAPVAAPAPAPAPHAAEENPYGLGALWAQGDVVAKGTLLILVIMSMGSWYVIFTKYFEQAKIIRFAKAAQDSFWSAGNVRQGADTLAEDSPFRFIAEKGLEGASNQLQRLGDHEHPTCHQQRAKPHARWFGFVGHRGFDGSFCGFVRYGLGYLQRLGQDWYVWPSQYRQSGWPCGRIAHHDCHRFGGGSACGARLQLVGAP
jgi:hypothetical protein